MTRDIEEWEFQKPAKVERQMMIPGSSSAEDVRKERRRAAKQIGLFRFERECRSVLVGRKRVKAWRVPGTEEYRKHAEIVEELAREFSRYSLEEVTR